MDRATGIFVDGLGAAAATSGVLSQLQGRIFALLYLRRTSLALEEIAAELQQSKSNISINMRGLVEWHLVRRIPAAAGTAAALKGASHGLRDRSRASRSALRRNPHRALVASHPRGARLTPR